MPRVSQEKRVSQAIESDRGMPGEGLEYALSMPSVCLEWGGGKE